MAADSLRSLEKSLLSMRLSSIDKDQPTRDRLKTLSDEILKLGQTFGSNIRDDIRTVRATPEQLAGLPRGSKPAADLVADFLQRPHNYDAYAKRLNDAADN